MGAVASGQTSKASFVFSFLQALFRAGSEDLSGFCFDDQYNYDACCLDEYMMPACWLGDTGRHAACCEGASGQVPVPYPATSLDAADIHCQYFLQNPERSRAREILAITHDAQTTCVEAYRVLQSWTDGPVLFVMASAAFVRLLDNFITHFAAQAARYRASETVHYLMVFTFDAESQEVCAELQPIFRYVRIACLPPRSSDQSTHVSDMTGGKGYYYYTINWFKAAVLQLLFDLGAAAVLWSDIDVILLQPLMRLFFHPLSRRIQVECEGVVIDGHKEVVNQNGLAFVSKLAMDAVAEWISSYNPAPFKSDGSGESFLRKDGNEMYALRDRPHLYQCLGLGDFQRAPTPEHKDAVQAVSVHFWIAGSMWKTIPAHLSSHVDTKIYLMQALDCWYPTLPWPTPPTGPEPQEASVVDCITDFESGAFTESSGSSVNSFDGCMLALGCIGSGAAFHVFAPSVLENSVQHQQFQASRSELSIAWDAPQHVGVCAPSNSCPSAGDLVALGWRYYLHHVLRVPQLLVNLALPEGAHVVATFRSREEVLLSPPHIMGGALSCKQHIAEYARTTYVNS